MHYTFPTITHINDVLPAIQGRDEFIIARKDGYQVVNYAVAFEDTFPPVMTGGDPTIQTLDDVYDEVAAVRRECRGLIFDDEGNLISRRYRSHRLVTATLYSREARWQHDLTHNGARQPTLDY